MKVHVFRSLSDDSPARFIARIRCPMVGAKGKLVEAWHPVIFEAPTAGEATARATRWWDEEVEKANRKAANRQAQSERMRTARQAKIAEDADHG